MSASCFESSCGVKNGFTGTTCAPVAITAISATSISIEFAIISTRAFAAAETALRKIPREAADRAAKLRIREAPVLVDHGRDVRVSVDGREQHVHEALVARQVPIDVALPADV